MAAVRMSAVLVLQQVAQGLLGSRGTNIDEKALQSPRGHIQLRGRRASQVMHFLYVRTVVVLRGLSRSARRTVFRASMLDVLGYRCLKGLDLNFAS